VEAGNYELSFPFGALNTVGESFEEGFLETFNFEAETADLRMA
jgi:hypothetical protein